MQDRLLQMTLLFACIFFILSMGIMAYANKYKIIYVEEMDIENQMPVVPAKVERSLKLEAISTDKYQLTLQIPDNIQSQSIQIQNQYTKNEVWIYIKSSDNSFYNGVFVEANLNKVVDGTFETVDDGILLKFQMDKVYEYTSVIEGDSLQLAFKMPEQVYDNRVVIDTGSFDTIRDFATEECNEKEIISSILHRIKAQDELENIRIYYCGLEDEEISGLDLAEAVNADVFIGLQVGWDKGKEKYGIDVYYNEEYFSPQLECGKMAHILATSVATKISDRVNDIHGDCDRYAVLTKSTRPSFILEVGYLSNEKEASLLQQETYQEKIAYGVVDAINQMIQLKEGGSTNE